MEFMGSPDFFERNMKFRRKVPSLLQLCLQTAIDNVRYLGDVGDTDIELLKDILPHCTTDQLMYIENSSEGRDLSPVTDKLWRNFYKQQFGDNSYNKVIEKMKRIKVSFKWRDLYEAKTKDVENAQKDSVNRLKQRYIKESERKQSRQVRVCTKVPPSKRSFFGGSGYGSKFSSVKGNLMQKARMEYRQSHEAKIHADMRRNALNQGASRQVQQTGFRGKLSASSSKIVKPLRRS